MGIAGARIFADVTPQEALAELKERPRRFLQRHLVVQAGLAAHHPSGIYPYYLGFMGGDTTRFRIGSDAQMLDPGHASFMAYVVRMTAYDQVADPVMLDTFELSNLGGPEIMVTGQLTGCAFVCSETNNGVRMTHLRPGAGQTGLALRTALTAEPFVAAAAAPTACFGVGAGPDLYDSATERVTVIGVRKDGVWKVYAQIQTAMPAAVARVVRIRPPAGWRTRLRAAFAP